MTAERGHVSTSPAPGEGIADQLALLDRQIARWAAAVRDLQASLSASTPAVDEQPVAGPAPHDEPETDSWAPAATEAVRATTAVEQVVAPEPVPVQPQSADALPAPRADRDPDEAALLASLDAETVTLIRVRQRLSPGRSVRDLLGELEGGRRKGKGGPGEP
jgi:hypothetical protein